MKQMICFGKWLLSAPYKEGFGTPFEVVDATGHWSVSSVGLCSGLVAYGMDSKENFGKLASSSGTYLAVRLGLREIVAVVKEVTA